MKIIKTIPKDANFQLFESVPNNIYCEQVLQRRGAETLNQEHLVACYVMVKNGEAVARLALFQNPHLLYEGLPTASIGNYESVDQLEVVKPLIDHAITAAKAQGAKYIIGGMNGSTWDNYRFSTHNDEANFLLEPYHHLYYNAHFESCDFGILSNYFSSLDRQMLHDHPKVVEREKELIEKGLTIRSIDLEEYEKELKRLHPFVNNAFKTNFLYTPISWAAFRQKYLPAKNIIDPRLVLIAEDEQQNIVGVFFCIPDHLNQKEKSLIFKTIARDPDPMWRGLGHVVANRIYKSAVQAGFQTAIHAFIIDQGSSVKVSKNFSGTVYKNYVLYGKAI